MPDADVAALVVGSDPARSRHRQHAYVQSLEPGAHPLSHWAFLFDCWDAPPGWFGGIPAVDLQPQLILAAQRGAIRGSSRIAEQMKDDLESEALLRSGFVEASDALRELAGSKPALYAGSGATGVAMALSPRAAAIAWVGACRAYLLRGEKLTQLTHDQTMERSFRAQQPPLSAADLARLRATPMWDLEISTLPLRTDKSGAPPPGASIETLRVELLPQDLLLLLTRETHRACSPGELVPALRAAPSAHAAASAVVTAALARQAGHALGVLVARVG